jgi:hypothetical protein
MAILAQQESVFSDSLASRFARDGYEVKREVVVEAGRIDLMVWRAEDKRIIESKLHARREDVRKAFTQLRLYAYYYPSWRLCFASPETLTEEAREFLATHQLEFVSALPPCDRCGVETMWATGSLGINGVESARWFRERREVEEFWRTHDSCQMGDPTVPRATEAPWRWLCDDCTNVEATGYWVGGERLDTLPKVWARTDHLAGKVWFDWRPWNHAIRRLYPALPH